MAKRLVRAFVGSIMTLAFHQVFAIVFPVHYDRIEDYVLFPFKALIFGSTYLIILIAIEYVDASDDAMIKDTFRSFRSRT